MDIMKKVNGNPKALMLVIEVDFFFEVS